MYTHKMVNGIEVALTAEEIVELEARDAVHAAEQAAIEALKPINDAKAELETLDKKVPRGLEDLIAALGTPALLAPVTIEVVTRKAELRTIIRNAA
jgi:hypothetical protein